ncbi:MutS2 protein [Nitzschia inconspicua]|uniref:MutS2 protein n=1 Tax=Nitzschia inconspicua TaxID=303405 RepID=A0A9K3KMH0_9STRA|nr:MutS2 protein [Nitzschia inconspicua]
MGTKMTRRRKARGLVAGNFRLRITLILSLASSVSLAFLHSTISPRNGFGFGRPFGSPISSLLWSSQQDVDTLMTSLNSFPDDLINALDLQAMMEDVARHAATKRGHRALMAVVETKPTLNSKNKIRNRLVSSNKRRDFMNELVTVAPTNNKSLLTIAQSAEEVRHHYQLVEEATALLHGSNDNPGDTVLYPPIYGADSDPFQVDTIPETDDDEWLWMPPNEITAEQILQAEQVLNSLLRLHQWSRREHSKSLAPHLAEMANEIDMESLKDVFAELEGAVEIKRVRSITDIQGKSSYTVRLKPERFPVLQLLHEKEDELLQRGGKEFDENVVAIQNEIEVMTNQIVAGLAQRLLGVSSAIHHGLDIVATLDTIMSRAAYGISLDGAFPSVKEEGEIQVEKFIHPVLASAIDAELVVPVDLRLPSESGEQALVISGPNGGGKSISMKSFGMVSVLSKLGIPIPVSEESKRPRIDFFDKILVNIGDNQNVLDGESTWTSILNTCATIIETLNNHDGQSSLVLLDEFGSAGTDPEACGAVAQAILEEMMTKSCKIAVTTHSPRLKALSFEQSNIGCAAVLLNESTSSTEYKLPSFKLEYGIIGESYALGAASRTRPSLPSSVICRASELMSLHNGETEESSTHKSYIQALASSMEVQLERTKQAAVASEELQENLKKCREAMIALTGSYSSHLDRQLAKLDDTFKKLKEAGKSEIDLVGETIAELKIIRKKIIDQQERLAQQGLRVLPIEYKLTPGESVVILSNGEWEGMTAKVVSDASATGTQLNANEVLVRPSSSLHAWDDVVMTNLDPMEERPLIIQRHELAIWEYDGAIDDSYKSKPATSISDSKRKVDLLLATINSVSTSQKTGTVKRGGAFQSSRDRKAASKGKKKRK